MTTQTKTSLKKTRKAAHVKVGKRQTRLRTALSDIFVDGKRKSKGFSVTDARYATPREQS